MSYLNYSIREVDGKLKLFDDKGERVKCFLAIHPKSKHYFTTWGVFEFSKSKDKYYPKNLTTYIYSSANLWRDSETAVRFVKYGHVGWKTPSGDLIMPPIFDQIEVCESFIWAKYGNRQIFVRKSGGMTDQGVFDNAFYQNGKK